MEETIDLFFNVGLSQKLFVIATIEMTIGLSIVPQILDPMAFSCIAKHQTSADVATGNESSLTTA